MKLPRLVPILALGVPLLILLAPLVGAQDSPAYVSRLAAQPGPRSVLLTWKDAEGWSGVTYEVWRSDKEIVKDSLPQSKLLGTVAAGVEAFEDTTVTGPSYYLVLLKDKDGSRKGFYVPYRNKTTEAVKADGSAPASTARVKVGAPTYANPQILVPFTAFPPDRKLVVLRRASPMTTLADLKDATLLGNTTGAQAPWHDTPAPGLEFYYAVLDAQAWSDGKADAFQIDNATERPVGFPLVALPAAVQAGGLDASLRPTVATGARSLPLPRLQVGTEPDSGAALAPAAYDPVASRPLASETARVLSRWSKAPTPVTALPPAQVLAEERTATQDGSARYLVQIQGAYLGPRDWKGGQAALESLLKLTLEARTEARARFYLGECLAYQGQTQGAFVEFLAARDLYPAETKPFLEALFSLLEAAD